MLDERVRTVLERLEAEDAAEREQGLPQGVRARSVARTPRRRAHPRLQLRPGVSIQRYVSALNATVRPRTST